MTMEEMALLAVRLSDLFSRIERLEEILGGGFPSLETVGDRLDRLEERDPAWEPAGLPLLGRPDRE